MNKETIYNQYAIEQGYDSWRDLTMEYGLNGQVTTSEYLEHQNKVTDLIQEELKNKVTENLNIRIEILGQKDLAQITKECYFKESGAKVTIDKISILNTEIL